ncbi:MAG: ABC transporter ATP-binding protein [Pirellulales bacterium]
MLLAFDNVTKLYGPVIGVNDVSCQVGPGITGLLGANGAGKSTMLKLASGQLRPSLGRVRVGPHDAWSTAAKRHFGYSPDINSFYEEMTGREFVRVMARLCGFSRAEARDRTEEALAETGMTDRAERRIAGCSHGMRQRIKLAQALVADPPILLLDEPLTGIDPGGRREINALLRRLADRGKTVLVSSHILVEVEHLVDSILVIASGRVLASGTLAEIRGLLEDQPFSVEIIADRARDLAALLVQSAEVRSIDLRDDALVIRTRNPAQFFSTLGDLVLAHRFNLHRIETLDAGADAVFEYLQKS